MASGPAEATKARPVARAIEGAAALDAPAKALAKGVRGVLSPGPVKDALSGTWLGHALHPLLTDTVIGTWTSALLLDLAGGKDSGAADRLVAAGIVCALPTALTGVSDWGGAEAGADGGRRVGAVHATGNVAALGLQTASLLARRRGERGRGRALSLSANALLALTGYLGGHLTLAQGIGVDQTVFDPGTDDWTDAVAADQVGTEPVAAVAGETPVLIVRAGG